MKNRKRQMIAFLCAMVFCFISSIAPVNAEDSLGAIDGQTGDSAVYVESNSISLCEDPETGGAAFSVKNVSFQSCFGDQLDTLSKEIYDVMVANYVKDGKMGDIEADFSVPFMFEAEVVGDTIEKNEDYNNVDKEINEAMGRAYQAFMKDYPQVFWISSLDCSWKLRWSSSVNSSTATVTIQNYTLSPVPYTDIGPDKIAEFNSGVAAAKAAIRANLEDDTSVYEILKAVHDYLCGKLAYNYDALLGGDEYQYAHNVYTVFADNRAVVCEGYAKAFKVLCDEFGIPCILVTGNGFTGSDSEAHMWNYVKLEDGKWYAVDVTWDDQDAGIQYIYFLAGGNTQGINSTFSLEHEPDDVFVYPVLADVRYVYDEESEKQLSAGKAAAKAAVEALTATNDTTEEDIVSAIQDALGGGFAVAMSNFTKTDATASAAGRITGTVTLTLSENRTAEISVSLAIAKLNAGTTETPDGDGGGTEGGETGGNTGGGANGGTGEGTGSGANGGTGESAGGGANGGTGESAGSGANGGTAGGANGDPGKQVQNNTAANTANGAPVGVDAPKTGDNAAIALELIIFLSVCAAAYSVIRLRKDVRKY